LEGEALKRLVMMIEGSWAAADWPLPQRQNADVWQIDGLRLRRCALGFQAEASRLAVVT